MRCLTQNNEQVDFTMNVYRGRRLRDLMAEYEASDLARRNDER
ncbi:MAG: hypothetical protein ACYTDU_00020 [Planctomycetota bacterium]